MIKYGLDGTGVTKYGLDKTWTDKTYVIKGA